MYYFDVIPVHIYPMKMGTGIQGLLPRHGPYLLPPQVDARVREHDMYFLYVIPVKMGIHT